MSASVFVSLSVSVCLSLSLSLSMSLSLSSSLFVSVQVFMRFAHVQMGRACFHLTKSSDALAHIQQGTCFCVVYVCQRLCIHAR